MGIVIVERARGKAECRLEELESLEKRLHSSTHHMPQAGWSLPFQPDLSACPGIYNCHEPDSPREPVKEVIEPTSTWKLILVYPFVVFKCVHVVPCTLTLSRLSSHVHPLVRVLIVAFSVYGLLPSLAGPDHNLMWRSCFSSARHILWWLRTNASLLA